MALQFPDPAPTGRAGMVERIRRLLLTPKLEWPVIDAEPTTEKAVFLNWVVPLAAIAPVCALIRMLAFGYGALGITYRPSIGYAVTTAVVNYLVALGGTWVFAKIIDALAPTFGATPNPTQAMKVAAYSATASWLAGVFQLIPGLGLLALLGLYSLYLLWLGLPLLMRAPADKAGTYTVACIVAALVVFLLLGAIAGSVIAHAVSPIGPGGSLTFG